jgi:hypothetical protein
LQLEILVALDESGAALTQELLLKVREEAGMAVVGEGPVEILNQAEALFDLTQEGVAGKALGEVIVLSFTAFRLAQQPHGITTAGFEKALQPKAPYW